MKLSASVHDIEDILCCCCLIIEIGDAKVYFWILSFFEIWRNTLLLWKFGAFTED